MTAPFRRIFGRRGTPYLDSEDIFKINPEITKFVTKMKSGTAPEYMLKRGWLLMARSGQIYGLNGSVMLANEWHEGKIVSEHIIRIVPKQDIRPGYLQVAMGHRTLGRPLVIRNAFGTSVPELSPIDFADFPVIRFGDDLEEEIAEKVEKASQLRMKANEAEDTAVATVESFVESVLNIALDENGRVKGFWPDQPTAQQVAAS